MPVLDGEGESRPELNHIIHMEEKMNFPSRKKRVPLPREKGKGDWAYELASMGWSPQWGQRRGVVEESGGGGGGGDSCHRVGRLRCDFRGGAVSGNDRFQGVALAVGGNTRVLDPRELVLKFTNKGGTGIKYSHMCLGL